ncbi:MAG: (Fe-S)-binding protein [Gemmatimonadota bacterium]|nr:MAG: (Fe-S)-binding protein [Gemmatimonadota bacterium]
MSVSPRRPMRNASGSALRLNSGWPDLDACVHCGLCLPACPTYRLLREENDSPRGRIQLMRLAVEGRVGRRGAFAHHIDRCLGCRACEPACPAGVRFGSLLEKAREDRLEGAARVAAGSFVGLFAGPLSPFTYALLRGLRAVRVASAGARLPGRVGLLLAALAATAPTDRTLSARRAPAAPPPQARDAEEGDAERTYALLEGCVMKGLFARVHAASRRVLRAVGYSERPARGQTCCGALHAHAGLAGAARRLARRNIAAFERSGARWLVVDSAGCGAAIREYPDWLADSAPWRDRALRVASATRDVTRLVADSRDALAAEVDGTVAYDAPCHLSYGLLDDEAPLQALSAVRGLRVEPLPSAGDCCGGAGLFAFQEPTLSSRILEEKLREIGERNFEVVLTGNPGCMIQIGAGLRRAGSSAAVTHPVEILDHGIAAAANPG